MSFNASLLNLVYGLPFFSLLLAISLFPIINNNAWHKHCLKIIIGLSVAAIAFMVLGFGSQITANAVLHALIHEYIPFIIMIGSLYVITGGIHIAISGHATPFSNVVLLLFGGFLASLIGTTGSAMLLIRPLIQLNRFRRYKTHLVIFFIIIVANIGGSLSPLGDPPLFLGYLNGVPFLWPLKNLALPMMLIMLPLLLIFYGIDRYYFSKDPSVGVEELSGPEAKFSVTGKVNFILLLGVVVTIAVSGMWHDSPEIGIADLNLNEVLRELLLISLAALSWQLTSGTVRHYNSFTWAPLREVAEIFIAIFITIIPVIAMLHAGEKGPFAGLLALANPNGVPHSALYFWLTGILSAFLDNAPTYLVFFHMAGGDVATLTTTLNQTLIAISAGAVFMGALTYIGNAPNFMIRSIAEKAHVRMPSFFGYMAWSLAVLVPLFIVLTIIKF